MPSRLVNIFRACSARLGPARLGPIFRAVAVLTLLVGLGGCYERVVSARGPGTRNVEVHEANLKNERIPIVDDVEDAVFGKRDYGVRKDTGIRSPNDGVKPPR